MNWNYHELRRAVLHKRTFLAIALSFASLLYGCYDSDSPNTGYIDLFLFSTGYGTTSVLALLYPLIAVLPFAMTYRQERLSGYYDLICRKTGRVRYCLTKASGVFFTGMLVIGLPNFLFLILCLVIKQGLICESNVQIGFLWLLYFEHPFLYGLVFSVNTGLCGGIFALLGLGISAWVKNKYIAALLPFAYLIFSGMVLANIHPWLNAINLYPLCAYGADVKVYIVYDAVLLCIGIFLFVTGVYYEDFKA